MGSISLLVLLLGIHGLPSGVQDDGDLVLARSGTTTWTLVLPERPSPVEEAAAARLQRVLSRLAGVTLPLRGESAAPHERRLWLGGTQAAAGLPATLQPPVGADAWAIRAHHGDLYLLGRDDQGLEHAVTVLLERFGARMWAPGALEAPRRDSLRLPRNLSLAGAPPTPWRYVHYGPVNDPEYRQWHGIDRIQDEIGRTRGVWWVHSLLRLLPPEKYFASHPEYYALVGGKRRPTQLCLTNPEVLRLVIEAIRHQIEEHPGLRTISVSQADNQEYCQCPDAQAIDEREGGPMGEMLQFVNAVAEAFPDRTISTLAYQYTRKPPAHLRPRSNVSITLCTIEENRSRPIAARKGSRFAADLAGWRAICDDIFLWDYEVQFSDMVAPFPDLRVLQPNVRWFVDQGVRHLFLQGGGEQTELAELRCYLLCRLVWNPDLNVAATTAEFLRGYTGPAAPALGEWIALLHDEMEASGQPLRIFSGPAAAQDSWLRPEVLARGRELLDRAAAAVADDPERSRRVRRFRLPLLRAELEIARRHGATALFTPDPTAPSGWKPRPEVVAEVEEFVTGCVEAGIPRLREWGLTPAEYRTEWKALLDPTRLANAAFRAPVHCQPPPSPKWADGDPARLTDGVPGGDRRDSNWLGWEGCDAVIEIELGGAAPRREFRLQALQDPEARIFLPRRIVIEGALGDGPWRELAELVQELPAEQAEAHLFHADLGGERLDRLRLRVEGSRVCPPGHPAAGQPSWFFLGEAEVD